MKTHIIITKPINKLHIPRVGDVKCSTPISDAKTIAQAIEYVEKTVYGNSNTTIVQLVNVTDTQVIAKIGRCDEVIYDVKRGHNPAVLAKQPIPDIANHNYHVPEQATIDMTTNTIR